MPDPVAALEALQKMEAVQPGSIEFRRQQAHVRVAVKHLLEASTDSQGTTGIRIALPE